MTLPEYKAITPAEALDDAEVQELIALEARLTPGPWAWFGYVPAPSGQRSGRELYLATVQWGRHFVMDFERWGFNGAQPRFQVELAGGAGIMRGAADLVECQHHNGQVIGTNHPDMGWMARGRQDLRRLLATVIDRQAKLDALVAVADVAAVELVALRRHDSMKEPIPLAVRASMEALAELLAEAAKGCTVAPGLEVAR